MLLCLFSRLDDDDGRVLYEEDSSLAQFACNELDKALVENWYVARAILLEDRSKLVDHALSLISLGLARGVTVSGFLIFCVSFKQLKEYFYFYLQFCVHYNMYNVV
jgi:hypothetical protein